MTGSFAVQRALQVGFEDAVARLPAALGSEGFGVLTQIDVEAVFAQKLGLPFRRYRIFGACNPALAHRALAASLMAGVMLPCNVVLWEGDDGRAVVTAVDPTASPAAAADPALAELAREVRQRLERVLVTLAAPGGEGEVAGG
jgi:uncharacterized protein (DUF302 family)